VDQLSFYSADARRPDVADLAGVLCGPGRAVGFGRGTAARLSVVLDERWRARSLAAACAERGVEAQLGRSDDGHLMLRTAFRSDLTALAERWLCGTVKSVPDGFVPDGQALRVWALTSGQWVPGGYLLGLDPDAPETHQPLMTALARSCLPARLVGPRAGGPGLRVTGRRRIERLAELVGPLPDGVGERTWPLVS
jgi:hypothetical protein